ncbi:MAG: LysR family transcriptional regulator [Clostridia bacterium]|jgi:DNA-binding transcriptional LysR family regulator|nr:LysR family transcriptional regulator [Clostridia bacterium]
MVDYRLLSLLKIVETGSFTKASGQLGLSQPAVSQHIRQLEEYWNVKIFEHAHNRFTLTPEGELIVRYAQRMAALSNNLKQALKNEKEQIHSLTIGITHTAESSAIIEALAAYTNNLDRLNLKILTNTTDNLYTMLRTYELDFAFVEGKIADPAFRYLMLDTDCLVLAVPPTHRLAKQSMISIHQLKEEKLILRLPNSNTRNLFTASLETQGLSIDDFNVTMEIDSIASIKDLIRRGFGVSILARSACMDEIKKEKLVALSVENLSMMREINIVYLKDYEHLDFLNGIVKRYNEMQRK